MKTLYKTLWLAALPLAFAACQNEEIETGATGEQGINTLHCTMGNYTPQSRAQVEMGNVDLEHEFFMWNRGDAFTVYDHTLIDPDATGTRPATPVFTIMGYKDEEPSASADFVCTEELTEGHSITAIYPVQNTTVNKGIIELALPEDNNMGSNTEEEIQAYMSSRMFMHATTQVEANTSITFSHLCAMARVTYNNATPNDQTIYTLQLHGNNEYFGKEMEFNLLKGNPIVRTTSTYASLDFNGLTIPSGKTVDFYLLFFPGQEFTPSGTFDISMNIGGATQTVSMSVDDFSNKKFEAGMRYWFNVVQTPNDGLIWKKNIEKGVISNLLLIKAIEEQTQKTFAKDKNGFVHVSENEALIENITTLYFNNIDINQAEGLEYFTKLKELSIIGPGALNEGYLIRKLDVSHFPNLELLDCRQNLISELDLSNNLNLKILSCGDNPLTDLDLSNNKMLEVLNAKYAKYNSPAYFSGITSLNLSYNTKLKHLIISNWTKLTNLDLTNNKNLQILDASACNFNRLEIDNNTELEELMLIFTPIKELNITKHTKLRVLNCSSTDIDSLEVNANINLEELGCSDTKVSSLNVNQNTKLKELSCSSTQISTLDISKNTNLINLDCAFCSISTLDITNNSLLESLRIGNQHNENKESIELTLTLTTQQNEILDFLFLDPGNKNVIRQVKE